MLWSLPSYLCHICLLSCEMTAWLLATREMHLVVADRFHAVGSRALWLQLWSAFLQRIGHPYQRGD